jgi:sulfoxide reductase catalytic subunit YedY
MKKKWFTPFRESEVTSEDQWAARRQFMLGSLIPASLVKGAACPSYPGDQFNKAQANSYKQITTYNNYYEFSTNKEHVHLYTGDFNPDPWQLQIDGEVEKPLTLDITALTKKLHNEERIYKLRCVEGWSMIIRWPSQPPGPDTWNSSVWSVPQR